MGEPIVINVRGEPVGKAAKVGFGNLRSPRTRSEMDQKIDVRRCESRAETSEIQAGSIDLIITDPPYESLEKHRAIGTSTRLKDKGDGRPGWFDVITNDQLVEMITEFYRVLRPDRHCYVFCDFTTAEVINPAARAAGFTTWTPVVWDKVRIGMGYHYRSRYELILFWEKGARRLADLGVPNVLSAKAPRGYPTEKPIKIVETLARQSIPWEMLNSRQEALFSEVNIPIVFDPFCGSGVVGEVALNLGCVFIGFDSSEEAVRVTRERLEKWGRNLSV